MQSDCGVHGSLAQAGVPGLVPSNHPFQEIKQPTIHGAIWPPSPPRKSGPKHSTRQPAGSQSRSSAGIRSFINPSMDDANSASTSQLSHPPAAQAWVGSIPNSSLCNLLPPQTHPVTSHLLWPLPLPFTFLLKSLRP